VAERGVTDEEVRRSQGNLRGSMVLGLEDSGSRMSRLGKAELVHGEVLTPEQVLERIRSVTPDEVREVARDVLTRPRALAVIGPYGDTDLQEALG
jgi:predicted Zn-dependent peptidase